MKPRPPETDFERGARRFGYLLTEVTLLLVIAMFAFNVYLHRPVLESLLFSMALAVGRRLVLATLGVVAATVALPYLPFASLLGFKPLPGGYVGAIALIVALYIGSGELAKRFFYRRFDRAPSTEPRVVVAS